MIEILIKTKDTLVAIKSICNKIGDPVNTKTFRFYSRIYKKGFIIAINQLLKINY